MEFIFSFVTDHYVEIVIGVISSIVFLTLQWTYVTGSDVIRFSRSKYQKYLGNYHIYSFSTAGSDDVFEGKMSIKQRFGRLYVEEQDAYFSYTGTIKFTGRNIFLHLTGKNHPEEVLYVFHHPLTGMIRKLTGVAACTAGTDEPCAFKVLLTDKQLSKDAVRQELSAYDGKKFKNLLKIPKTAEIYDENKADSTTA